MCQAYAELRSLAPSPVGGGAIMRTCASQNGRWHFPRNSSDVERRGSPDDTLPAATYRAMRMLSRRFKACPPQQVGRATSMFVSFKLRPRMTLAMNPATAPGEAQGSKIVHARQPNKRDKADSAAAAAASSSVLSIFRAPRPRCERRVEREDDASTSR